MKNCVILLIFLFGIQSISAQKQVALYWDASYSMKDRLLDRELKYLNNYFVKNTEVDLTLVMFSNEILLQEKFEIRDGNWIPLQQELQRTIYDGATSYSVLFKQEYDEYLLFTDGIENINDLKPPTTKPIYIISTLDGSNTINLKLIADLSSGSFLYLNKQSNVVEQIELNDGADNTGNIIGGISGVEGPLGAVSIVNKTTGKGVVSGISGDYKIKANEGDTLEYSFLGKKTVSVKVLNVNVINVTMGDMDENLDEVTITTKTDNEEKIVTGYGEVNRDPVGYATQTINSDQISESTTDVGNAVIGKFTGLKLANNQDLSLFKGRGSSLLLSEYGLIVVDGVPIDRSTIGYEADTDFIDPNNIESITHLKGLAATNRYGTEGNNGVILITTKTASAGKAKSKKQIVLGTTATYSGDAQNVDKLADTDYLRSLSTSKDIDEAFNDYLNQRETYGNKPEFYLDVYDYFKGWNNDLLSKRVLSNVYEIAFNDSKMLRALAYKQQSNADYEAAVITLKRVLKLKPKESQSYKDLALAQAYAGNSQDALTIYTNIDKRIKVGGSNFNGIRKTITNDAKNLVFKHKSKLNVSNINPLYLRNIKYRARIMIEWNDFNSEFDLNIINPQKRFFTWSHTNSENSARIRQEKDQGYGLEEFYLTSTDIGEWTFNIKYYGKTSNDKSPTFIKITIYKNFGMPNETKDIQVVRLEKQNIEQTAVKLMVD